MASHYRVLVCSYDNATPILFEFFDRTTNVIPSRKMIYKNIKNNFINRRNLNLLYLGRYRKEKGIHDFIQLINASELNYHLKIYGVDYAKSFINSKRVTYLPQITNINKIIKAYDDCDIFILPPYTESSHKVIWESLARLRPVIVFDEIRHVAKNKIGV